MSLPFAPTAKLGKQLYILNGRWTPVMFVSFAYIFNTHYDTACLLLWFAASNLISCGFREKKVLKIYFFLHIGGPLLAFANLPVYFDPTVVC